MSDQDLHAHEYVILLQSLIQEQSLSGEEHGTADIIERFLSSKNISTKRLNNNVIAYNHKYDNDKPTVVLNSHHDTVAIGSDWTYDPLGAIIENGKLYGRGSNDAGGALVSLIATFVHFYKRDSPFNLLLIASGEEENFGPFGVSSVLSTLSFEPALGIIGEPTEMEVAIAEKGLIVIDGEVEGVGGHAARMTGRNALYEAIEDIENIKNYTWDRVSEMLGQTMTTVTQINAGSQHNVIPDRCNYVIDCRVNEYYSLQEVMDVLNNITVGQLTPRSLRWHPSGIPKDHPIVKSAQQLGHQLFGSPTLSDQVHFNCSTIKIGPGRSERSHTADEYIYVSEIEEGIKRYIELIKKLQEIGI